MIEVFWALKADVIINLKGLYNNHSVRVKDITQLLECSFNTHEALTLSLALHTPDLVVCTCNSSTQEVETGGSRVHSPQLHV